MEVNNNQNNNNNNFYLSIKNNHRRIEDVRNLFQNLSTREKQILEEEKIKAEKAKMEKDLKMRNALAAGNEDKSRKLADNSNNVRNALDLTVMRSIGGVSTFVTPMSEKSKENHEPGGNNKRGSNVNLQKSDKIDFALYHKNDNKTTVLLRPPSMAKTSSNSNSNSNASSTKTNRSSMFDQYYDQPNRSFDDLYYKSSSSFRMPYEFNAPPNNRHSHYISTSKTSNNVAAHTSNTSPNNNNNHAKITNIIFNNERRAKLNNYIKKYNGPTLFRDSSNHETNAKKSKKHKSTKTSNPTATGGGGGGAATALLLNSINFLDFTSPSSGVAHQNYTHAEATRDRDHNAGHLFNNVKYIQSKVLAKKNIASFLEYNRKVYHHFNI